MSNAFDALLALRSDCCQRFTVGRRPAELEACRWYTEPVEELLCPIQRLFVDEREPELVSEAHAAAVPSQRVDADVRVPTNHSAQVAKPILRAVLRGRRQMADTDQLVVRRQMWTAVTS